MYLCICLHTRTNNEVTGLKINYCHECGSIVARAQGRQANWVRFLSELDIKAMQETVCESSRIANDGYMQL